VHEHVDDGRDLLVRGGLVEQETPEHEGSHEDRRGEFEVDVMADLPAVLTSLQHGLDLSE